MREPAFGPTLAKPIVMEVEQARVGVVDVFNGEFPTQPECESEVRNPLGGIPRGTRTAPESESRRDMTLNRGVVAHLRSVPNLDSTVHPKVEGLER